MGKDSRFPAVANFPGKTQMLPCGNSLRMRMAERFRCLVGMENVTDAIASMI
jgi:hypothetical protein